MAELVSLSVPCSILRSVCFSVRHTTQSVHLARGNLTPQGSAATTEDAGTAAPMAPGSTSTKLRITTPAKTLCSFLPRPPKTITAHACRGAATDLILLLATPRIRTTLQTTQGAGDPQNGEQLWHCSAPPMYRCSKQLRAHAGARTALTAPPGC